MSFFSRFFKKRPVPNRAEIVTNSTTILAFDPAAVESTPIETNVQRHFFNQRGFQTYGSFFPLWGGHITAAHVFDASGELLPPFANGRVENWVGGLDAALIGCQVPHQCPPAPRPNEDAYCIGFPAGSSHPAKRHAKIYITRPGTDHVWIARITTPDEPVVTGMSGGVVVNGDGHPIGILITRNSPADLNNDRDPDESFDFVSLAGVWHAIQDGANFV